ncbi:MAG: hypothetical protein ACR2NG_04165 [Acidimicrobiia bacterium]
MVKPSFTSAALALMLVVSGCAAGETDVGAAPDSDSSATTIASTEQPTTTLVAENTTSTVTDTTSEATDTTTPPDQTTTTTFASEVTEAAELIASLETVDDFVSGRLEGSIEATGVEAFGTDRTDLKIVFSNAFDASTGNSAFFMAMSSPDGAFDVDPEFRQVGDRAYMNAGMFGLMVATDAEWISMPADEGAMWASEYEFAASDANEFIGVYEGANAVVESFGPESVNGTTAMHYRITFDTTAWIEGLSDQEKAKVNESGLLTTGRLPIELWITDDGYLVRMIVEVDGTQAMSADGEFETMLLRWDLFDIDGSVTIEAPPADQVVAVEDLGDF